MGGGRCVVLAELPRWVVLGRFECLLFSGGNVRREVGLWRLVFIAFLRASLSFGYDYCDFRCSTPFDWQAWHFHCWHLEDHFGTLRTLCVIMGAAVRTRGGSGTR